MSSAAKDYQGQKFRSTSRRPRAVHEVTVGDVGGQSYSGKQNDARASSKRGRTARDEACFREAQRGERGAELSARVLPVEHAPDLVPVQRAFG
jgi:hypothetical protein